MMSDNKISVLITGSNQGIGLAAAQILASSTSPLYHVFICSREISKGKEVAATLNNFQGTVEAIQLDTTDPSSVAAASEHVSKTVGKLDVLVNNAGISLAGPIAAGKMTAVEGMRQTLETNVVGSMAVTEAFLPLLQKSSDPRLIFVTSGLGSLTMAADPEHHWSSYAFAIPQYRSSKAALNMLMVTYHSQYGADARNKGEAAPIKTWTLCPGHRKTNLNNFSGPGSVDDAGQLIVDLVEGKRDEDVGKFVQEDGVYPW